MYISIVKFHENIHKNSKKKKKKKKTKTWIYHRKIKKNE